MYKNLLTDDNMSASERIVYSLLVYKAFFQIDDIFYSDGAVDSSVIDEAFSENDEVVKTVYTSVSKISRITGYSIRQIKTSISALKDMGLVSFNDKCYIVKILKNVINGGYFEVNTDKGKLSPVIILYFWLKNKSMKYDGVIDTWLYRIAEDYNTTINNVKVMLSRLKKIGLVERTENNKLLIK